MAGQQPTYLYLGGSPTMGGVQPDVPSFFFPTGTQFWGQFLNKSDFSRVVPSSDDGHTPPTLTPNFAPQWDGSLNGGAGAFCRYHYTVGVIPGTGNGDNWFWTPGGAPKACITPYTMLMAWAWQRHPDGFRAMKYAEPESGLAAGLTTWKPSNGTAWANFVTQWNRMRAAAQGAGDTLSVECVIVDFSAGDIEAGISGYYDAALEIIDALVTLCNPKKIVFVTHRTDFNLPRIPNALNIASIHKQLQFLHPTLVRTFQMSWAKFGTDGFIGGTIAGPKKITYETDDYVSQGLRMGRFIEAISASEPAPDPGAGIPVLVLIGDSMGLAAYMSALAILTSGAGSLLGYSGNTEMVGVWTFNGLSDTVEQYDVLYNTNTMGSVDSAWGLELPMARAARKDYPNGVLIFKVQIPGAALTSDAYAGVMEFIKTRWNACKSAAIRDLNRVVDTRAVTITLGTNDAWDPANAAGFVTKAPTFVDDLNQIFRTRTDEEAVSLVWVQPAPHADSGVAGGSIQGDAASRASVRTTVATLPTLRKGVVALLDPGGKYELQRPPDGQHYTMESVFKVGDDAWALHRTQLFDVGGAESESTVDAPSETATFIVEDGQGLTNANAACTVEVADEYHQLYGNPAAWSQASVAKKKDSIRLMTRWLSTRYVYRGTRRTQQQALPFPRFDLVDQDDYDIPSNVVPKEWQHACAYGALRILRGDWTPFPDEVPTSQSSSESISVGPISFSTSGPAGGTSTEVRLPVVESLIRHLLRPSRSLLKRG